MHLLIVYDFQHLCNIFAVLYYIVHHTYIHVHVFSLVRALLKAKQPLLNIPEATSLCSL